MALDTAPPLLSWVSVYGCPAMVTGKSSALPSRIRVEFPPEIDLDDLDPGPDPSACDGRGVWVPLREPTLHTVDSLLAGLAPSSCTLAGNAAQFAVLRAALESARLLLVDAGPPLSPALAVIDQFLAQLPASPLAEESP